MELIEKNYREAGIVITPEYSIINLLAGLKPNEVYALAEDVENSMYLSKLADLASRLDVLISTHMIEKSHEKPRSYSSSILNKRIYRKIHLFDAYNYKESDYLLPGDALSRPVEIKDPVFYTAICHDIRFPELFRVYAQRGVHGILVQAGRVKGAVKEEVLDKLACTRSRENTLYLIVANQTSDLYTGRSGISNPYRYKERDLGFKPRYVEHPIVEEEV